MRRTTGHRNSIRKTRVHALARPPKPSANPSDTVGLCPPRTSSPYPHQRQKKHRDRHPVTDFFFLYLKTKSTSPPSKPPNKQKVRLNKIYSEYTQQTSVCAIKYCICYCGTNLKQTMYKCSGAGVAQVSTLWGLGRQDGGSEKKGKSISFFLILSI